MTQITTGRSATESRALTLLGKGISPVQVASAIGVSESRISQLMSDPIFADEVSALRFSALQKHNERDDTADAIEDALLRQLKGSLPLLMRPMEIARVYSMVNSAKRRGASAPEAVHNTQNIVTITMPTQVIQKFTTNIQNQVVQAGNQELLTIQSGAVSSLLAATKDLQATEVSYDTGRTQGITQRELQEEIKRAVSC